MQCYVSVIGNNRYLPTIKRLHPSATASPAISIPFGAGCVLAQTPRPHIVQNDSAVLALVNRAGPM
jgi:hypothetical protein